MFTKLSSHAREGDTTIFVNLNSENLYEVATAIKIEREDEETGGQAAAEAALPQVVSTAGRETLAVGIDRVLHVFATDDIMRSIKQVVFEGPIVSLVYTESEHLVLVALQTGDLAVVDIVHRTHTVQKVTESFEPGTQLFLNTNQGGGAQLSTFGPSGDLKVFHLPGFNDAKVADGSGSLCNDGSLRGDHIDTLLTNFTLEQDLKTARGSACQFLGSLQVFGDSEHVGAVVDADSGIFTDFGCPSVRTIRTVGKIHTVHLLNSSVLHVYDICGQFLEEIDPRLDASFNDPILDFQVVDAPDVVADWSQVLFVLLVSTERHGLQLQFRSKRAQQIDYTLDVGEQCSVMPASTAGDHNIIVVDPFGPRDEEAVVVRHVGETQPDMRLERLLQFDRFEDAELLADLYRLPKEKIHRKKIAFLIDQAGSTQSSVDRAGFMVTVFDLMKKVIASNPTGVRDDCLLVAQIVPCFDTIASALAFGTTVPAPGGAPDDVDMYVFVFDTLRLMGTTADTFDFAVWQQLIGSDDAFVELFYAMLSQGHVTRAGVLYQRHHDVLLRKFQEGNQLFDVLNVIVDAVRDNPQVAEQNLDFIRSFYGQDLLMLRSESRTSLWEVVNRLVGFTFTIMDILERMARQDSPKNILTASRLVADVVESFSTVTLNSDATKQELRFMMSEARRDTAPAGGDSTPTLARLCVKTTNLERMLHLKEKYGLTIYCQQYERMSARDVCYTLINNAAGTTHLDAHMRNVVLPFMKEFKLQRDPTLVEYFMSSAGSMKDSDFQAALVGYIKSLAEQCSTLTLIAQKAPIPWTKKLRAAVAGLKAKVPQNQRTALDVEEQRELLRVMLNNLGHPLRDADKLYNAEMLGVFLRGFFVANIEATNMDTAKQIVRLANTVFTLSCDPDLFLTGIMVHAVWIKTLRDSSAAKYIDMALSPLPSLAAREMYLTHFVDTMSNLLNHPEEVSPLEDSIAKASTLCIFISRHITSGARDDLRQALTRLRILRENYGCFVTLKDVQHPTTEFVTAVVSRFFDTSRNTFDYLQLIKTFGYSTCDACAILLDMDFIEASAYTILDVLVHMTRDPAEMTKSAVLKAVDKLQVMFLKVYDFIREPQMPGSEVHAQVREIFRLLARPVECLVHACVSWLDGGDLPKAEEATLKTLYRFEAFLQLVQDVIECFSNEAAAPQTKKPGDDVITNSSIFDNTELGFIAPKDIGPLCDSGAWLVVLGKAACTIFVPPNSKGIPVESIWSDIIFMSVANVLIEYKVRCMANAFFGIPSMDPISISTCATKLCQLLLSRSVHTDMYLAMQVMCSVPDERMVHALSEIYDWVDARNDAATTARAAELLTHLVATCDKSSPDVQQLTEAVVFLGKKGCCLRRFQEAGVHVTDVYKEKQTRADFLAALGSASILFDYCKAYSHNVTGTMFGYAFDLLRAHTSESDEAKRGRMLVIAADALAAVPSKDQAFVLQQCLKDKLEALCPYDYEAIQVLLRAMGTWAVGTTEEAAYVRDLSRLLAFVQSTPRVELITIAELRWFIQWRRRVQESTLYSGSIDETQDFEMSEAPDTQGFVDSASEVVSDEVLAQERVPAYAASRLPFHILVNSALEMEVIATKELTMDNVGNWLDLINDTTVVSRISRTKVAGTAIANKIKEYQSSSAHISSGVRSQISYLVSRTVKSFSILKFLAVQVWKLPLCRALVDVLQVLRDCARGSLNSSVGPSSESEEFAGFVAIAEKIIRRYECQLALEVEDIFIIDKNLLTNGDELINKILNDHIDWNNDLDIEAKFNLLRTIARIHGICYQTSLQNMISHWVNNDAPSFLKNAATQSQTPASIFPDLPYDDTEVIRVSHVLRRLNDPTAYKMLKAVLRSGEMTPATQLKKLQAACIILDCLNDDALLSIFGVDSSKFIEMVTKSSLKYAFSYCNVALDVDKYAQQEDKKQLVQLLIGGHSSIRRNVEATQLAAAIVIDERIVDPELVERILQRLCQCKSFALVKALLWHIRLHMSGGVQIDLGKYFALTFEALWSQMDAHTRYHKWHQLLYFLLRCPSPLSLNSNRIISLLDADKCPVAANMFRILSNQPMVGIDEAVSKTPNPKDLPLAPADGMHDVAAAFLQAMASKENLAVVLDGEEEEEALADSLMASMVVDEASAKENIPACAEVSFVDDACMLSDGETDS